MISSRRGSLSGARKLLDVKASETQLIHGVCSRVAVIRDIPKSKQNSAWGLPSGRQGRGFLIAAAGEWQPIQMVENF